MSGSLIETKKKIGSFRNTQKITKAMELVAASKMKNFQKKAVHTREFAWQLAHILTRNLTSYDFFNEYMGARSKGKTMFIIFTSDKGLCGPLNNQLLRGLFNSHEWKDIPKEERMLVTIGRKAHQFAKFNKWHVDLSFNGLNEKMTPLEALDVIVEIMKYWEDGTCKEIKMIAPHYKNAFTFYPVIKTFLPFSADNLREHIGEPDESKDDAHKDSENAYMLYEPGAAEVVTDLTEELVYTLFLQAFFELKASEYSSRMIAMKNATDAVDKLIEELTLELNKARQQVITTELADLINAAESVKDS